MPVRFLLNNKLVLLFLIIHMGIFGWFFFNSMNSRSVRKTKLTSETTSVGKTKLTSVTSVRQSKLTSVTPSVRKTKRTSVRKTKVTSVTTSVRQPKLTSDTTVQIPRTGKIKEITEEYGVKNSSNEFGDAAAVADSDSADADDAADADDDADDAAADNDIDPCAKWRRKYGGSMPRFASTRNCSLPTVYFPYRADLLKGNSTLLSFSPRMGPVELCVLLSALEAFHHVMTSLHIPYFIFAGTLLGSWRHHGVIPWDDDADVLVPQTRKEDVMCALENLNPDFDYTNTGGTCSKFFARDKASRPIHNAIPFPWLWPFVDVFFYTKNESRLCWGPNHTLHCLPKAWVFPTVPRPFHYLRLQAPRLTNLALESTKMEPDLCGVGGYSHVMERERPEEFRAVVNCKQLSHVFPLVQRLPALDDLKGDESGETGRCNETLRLGDVLVFSFLADYDC